MSLVELRIRELAVIPQTVVDVPDGFTVLTGETGAGKSVCIAALRLALGGRADADVIRDGAPSAVVTAVFDDAPPELGERLTGLGVTADDLLTLTREISRGARGSCRINGALVPQAVLRDVGESLAEITSQGASQRLLLPARQREILDLAAGTVELRDSLRAAVGRWRAGDAALGEARRQQAAGAAEVEAARQVVADLGQLELRPGEESELAGERLRLRNAASILAAATALHLAVSGNDDVSGAADLLAGAIDGASRVQGLDPGLDSLVADADVALEVCRELAASARSHAGAVVVDEERLSVVEERLDTLARLRRRYGSIERAVTALSAARRLLDARADGGGRIAAVEAELLAAQAEAAELAARLSQQRRRGAGRLERDVQVALGRLELPQARFVVALQRRPDPEGLEVEGTPVRCSSWGIDEVDFRLATSRTSAPHPLADGPSGGELSRLSLALAACINETGSPLLVLDEVDAGIGGETAARVGDLLAAIGQKRQVLAITHRAEIASRAHGHLLVRKDQSGDRVVAHLSSVDGEDRHAEIARLMSGRVTEAALARALELHGEARASAAAASPPARRPRRPALHP